PQSAIGPAEARATNVELFVDGAAAKIQPERGAVVHDSSRIGGAEGTAVIYRNNAAVDEGQAGVIIRPVQLQRAATRFVKGSGSVNGRLNHDIVAAAMGRRYLQFVEPGRQAKIAPDQEGPDLERGAVLDERFIQGEFTSPGLNRATAIGG